MQIPQKLKKFRNALAQSLLFTTYLHTEIVQNLSGRSACLKRDYLPKSYSSLNLAIVFQQNQVFLLLQAESMIPADYMIGVDIRRGLRDEHGDSLKTWIFRIPRSSHDPINVIRVGHCAFGVIHNILSCANSVMKLTGALLRFPRAWRR